MSTKTPARADDRATALKYLTLGLLLGLLLAPRAGGETWQRVLGGLSDLFGGVGTDEFAEPQP